jgi:hypothetical protein
MSVASENRQVMRALLSQALLHLDVIDAAMHWNDTIWAASRVSPQYLHVDDDRVLASSLRSALLNVTDELATRIADARGWNSDVLEGEPIAGPADMARALREPYPVATVLAAVAAALGVAVSDEVAVALTDCEPLPEPCAEAQGEDGGA